MGPDLRRQAAGRRAHAFGLQHPERVDAAPRAAPARRHVMLDMIKTIPLTVAHLVTEVSGPFPYLSLLVPSSIRLCACTFWCKQDYNICDRANIRYVSTGILCCFLQLVRSISGSSTGSGSAASMDPQARL